MKPDKVLAGAHKAPGSGMIVGLLALALFINYLDRGNLATAAPLIKDQMRLTNTQIGALGSAFFFVYAPGQVMAGWVIARLNPYRTMAFSLALWSLATMLSGLASGFAALLALRLLLGLGESASWPATSKLLAQHIAPEKLGSANAAILAGIYLGPALGTVLGAAFLARFGWRPMFVVFGGGSLLWLIPWLSGTRHASTAASAQIHRREPPYRDLLCRRQLWGTTIGTFAGNYTWFLLITWLPLYLVKVQGLSLPVMGELAGLVYLLSSGLSLLFGRLSDVWMRAGATSHRVRMTMVCTGTVIGIGTMLACALGSAPVAIAGLLVSAFANGLCGFNFYAIGQTLSGPHAAARWVGLQNGIGTLSGVVAPLVTGMIVDRTGSFSLAFVSAAVVGVAGLLAWIFLVRRIEPIDWTAVQPTFSSPVAPAA